MSPATDAADGYQLQTLARGAAVLDLLLERADFTLTEASHALELNTTVTFRLLRTWAARGYLHYDPDTKRYGAGISLLRLATRTRATAGIPQAQARLEELSRHIDQTCSCGVLVGREVLYVGRVLANRALTYNAEVGRTLPAFATAMGHALLAFEPEERLRRLFPEPDLPVYAEGSLRTRDELFERLALARERGWALNRGQLSGSICAVAAPVRDASGRVTAALSIAGPAEAFTDAAIEGRYLPALLRAVEAPLELR